jgi:hypothetical protein
MIAPSSRTATTSDVPAWFIEGLNVDLTALLPFEQVAAKMKMKRLWQLEESNRQLEEEIAQKISICSGKLADGVPVFLKVFDDVMQFSVILKVGSRDTAADVERLITEKLKRGVLLSIAIRASKVADFNDENLEQAKRMVAVKEATALLVCAQ